MVADGIDCFHRSLDFLFSISLISFQHHVQLRRKCSYRSTHWQWEDYLCGVCSTATSSANTWLQMCLRNSIAVPCWPGKSLERKLAWTVHPSVVTCAPCVHSAFVAYVFCYKVNLISCFENYPFPHYLHKFLVFPRFVTVFCFSCALSGCPVFRTWLRLSSFPTLGFGCLVFPRFARLSWFSRAWLQRLAPVALFSYAWLGFLFFSRAWSVCLFSRACLRMGCFSCARLRLRVLFPAFSVHVFRTWRIQQQMVFGPIFPPWFFRTGSLSSWFALVMQPMI